MIWPISFLAAWRSYYLFRFLNLGGPFPSW